jgi:hypothetical protein
MNMKRRIVIYLSAFLIAFTASQSLSAQCSICTKTAQQLGEKPAKALNTGIVYLAMTPVLLVSVIGYSWWRKNKHTV